MTLSMPRRLPDFAHSFEKERDRSLDVARAGELVRFQSLPGSNIRRLLDSDRLALLYEMAYLRIFIAWEDFLEQTFLRYMCGHASAQGQMAVTQGRPHWRSISAARAHLFGARRYLLWHNPDTVIKRSRQYFIHGLHEAVITSALAYMEHCANIRHRIAHGQEDARKNFDKATLHFAARKYRGARPGVFLRAQAIQASGPSMTWLDSLSADLVSLSRQIAPP